MKNSMTHEVRSNIPFFVKFALVGSAAAAAGRLHGS